MDAENFIDRFPVIYVLAFGTFLELTVDLCITSLNLLGYTETQKNFSEKPL